MCFAYHQPVWLYVCMCMCVPRMSKCLGRLLMMSDVIPLRGALVVEVALLIGFRLLLVRARVTVATLAHRAASVGADGGRGSRTGAAWRGARASAPLGRGSRVSRDVAPVGGEPARCAATFSVLGVQRQRARPLSLGFLCTQLRCRE